MALNSSTVLFLGLSNASDPNLIKTSEKFDIKQWSYVKNDITASYDFDHNTWTQHESLTYPSHATHHLGGTYKLSYGYEVLCSPYHGKNETTILMISFMVDNMNHFGREYYPFAWSSSINSISWNVLDIKANAFEIPGIY